MHKIKLFQNERIWTQIKKDVLALVDHEHESSGLAQNSTLVKKLESRLAEQFGKKHCITTASCTDALVIACELLGLPKGSKIGVANYTFTATGHAVARTGYTVVPIDVCDNYTISVDKIKDVDAVIAVDVFGNMSDWSALKKLNIPIINDAAQSIESHNGVSASASNGLISCLSFSPSKTISSWGSGGALLTDVDEYAELARRLRLHGKLSNNTQACSPGLNSMLCSFEAACIWIGLDHSEHWQNRRHEIANYLIDASQYKSGMDENLLKHTYHKLVFQSNDRKQIQQKFSLQNIDCAVHYMLTVNDEILYNTDADLLTSDRLKNVSFTVPNQHSLTDEEVERIAEVLA